MVSHQRRTMETADILYGVTMQAAGVSKLVSQRLEQAMGYASQDVTGNDLSGAGEDGSSGAGEDDEADAEVDDEADAVFDAEADDADVDDDADDDAGVDAGAATKTSRFKKGW